MATKHAPAAPEPLTLSVEEAGRLLGLGREGSYAAVKRGELPVIRIGKRLLVPKRALDAVLRGAALRNPNSTRNT